MADEVIEINLAILDKYNLPDSEKQKMMQQVKTIVGAIKSGKEFELSNDDKNMIDMLMKQMISIIMNVEANAITRESHLVDDLSLDSLAFLELYHEFKELFNLDLNVNQVTKYVQEHPVSTFGEFMDQIYIFISKKNDILAAIAAGDMQEQI